MINYLYDCYRILYKVYSEKTYIKQAIEKTDIEESNRALTVKTCYGTIDKDIELSFYLDILTDKTPKLAIRTILKISMYAIKYLGKHDYAIIKNAVELTKKLGKSGASGFVNAILRKFAKTEFELPKEEVKFLSVKYSYPEFMVKELLKDYGREKTEKILSVLEPKTCLSFYSVNGEEYLKDHNIIYEKTPFDNVYFAKNFVRNSDYDKGIYTFQSIGSVAICDVISPCENLLDCCAAPGGKSVRLSYKCDKVLSFDVHEHRVKLIEEYAERMGRENIEVSVKDSSVYDESLEKKFDSVLCDAPCSGSGVVFENPDIKLNRTESSLNELNELQLKILKTVSNYVKVGGNLYYSTCSIFDRENLSIINKFMSVVKGFEICKIDNKLNAKEKNGTLTFLPDDSLGAGFFVAKLKRIF